MPTEKMDHWERLRCTLAGNDVDRPPVSMWCHFWDRENTAEALAGSMLEYYNKYDWDFLKVQSRSTYAMEAFGLEVFYEGAKHGVTKHPISGPKDYLALKVPDVTAGPFKEMLDAADLINQGLNKRAPFIWTIFSPMVLASRMMPKEATFLEYLREYPQEANHALNVVADTLIAFAGHMIEHGATGFFYGTNSWGTTDAITEEEYRKYIMPYDLKVLEALPKVGSEFTLLHVCRDHCMVKAFKDYPVQIFNWDSRGEGNPSLSEVRSLVKDRTVLGGMNFNQKLVDATPEQLTAEVAALHTAMGNKHWILGGGCAFPWTTPEANLHAIREAIDNV